MGENKLVLTCRSSFMPHVLHHRNLTFHSGFDRLFIFEQAKPSLIQRLGCQVEWGHWGNMQRLALLTVSGPQREDWGWQRWSNHKNHTVPLTANHCSKIVWFSQLGKLGSQALFWGICLLGLDMLAPVTPEKRKTGKIILADGCTPLKHLKDSWMIFFSRSVVSQPFVSVRPFIALQNIWVRPRISLLLFCPSSSWWTASDITTNCRLWSHSLWWPGPIWFTMVFLWGCCLKTCLFSFNVIPGPSRPCGGEPCGDGLWKNNWV